MMIKLMDRGFAPDAIILSFVADDGDRSGDELPTPRPPTVSLTSPTAAIAWPPAVLISSAMIASASGERPVTATAKPSRAKRRAAAAPNPRLAPTPTTHAMALSTGTRSTIVLCRSHEGATMMAQPQLEISRPGQAALDQPSDPGLRAGP